MNPPQLKNRKPHLLNKTLLNPNKSMRYKIRVNVVVCISMQRQYMLNTLLSGKNVYQMCTGICRLI